MSTIAKTEAHAGAGDAGEGYQAPQGGPRFEEGKENSHKALDSTDERSIANRVSVCPRSSIVCSTLLTMAPPFLLVSRPSLEFRVFAISALATNSSPLPRRLTRRTTTRATPTPVLVPPRLTATSRPGEPRSTLRSVSVSPSLCFSCQCADLAVLLARSAPEGRGGAPCQEGQVIAPPNQDESSPELRHARMHAERIGLATPCSSSSDVVYSTHRKST